MAAACRMNSEPVPETLFKSQCEHCVNSSRSMHDLHHIDVAQLLAATGGLASLLNAFFPPTSFEHPFNPSSPRKTPSAKMGTASWPQSSKAHIESAAAVCSSFFQTHVPHNQDVTFS